MSVRFGSCACCAGRLRAPASAVSRRSFVAGGIAGLGAIPTGLGGARPAVAQAAAPAAGKPQRIDVHHHYFPPFHAEFIAARRD